MKPWEVRDRRQAQGLSLRQVARAAGTSETNVSAYERGTKEMRPATCDRILAGIEAGAASPIHRHRLSTFPAAAAALRRGLREQWSTADLLRLVRELRAHLALLSTPQDRAAFFAAPTTTGDPRWDAMLAGNAEDLSLRSGRPPPEWCRGHALPTFWFVGAAPSLQAYAFARSPFALQVRGVMVDPTDLEAV